MNLQRGNSSAVLHAFTRIGIAFVVAAIIGLFTGRVALALAIVLAVVLVFQLANLARVDRWLRHRRLETPPDVDGAWGELIAVIDRIYRRKQFHKARVTQLLREFRRLTTAMPEGGILLGPENEILWFNRRAAEWLHLRRKRDFGIRVENLIRHPSFVAYLRSGSPEEGVTVFEPGESSRWLSFNLVRAGQDVQVPRAQGRAGAAAGQSARQLLIVRDVTRQMQLETMRKDFVANASHELRSPLTVISGYLDALADDEKLDPTWSSPVLEMRRQAERMGTIINDLLELSKLESSGQRLTEDSPVDISGMLAMLRKEVLALDARPRKIVVNAQSDALLRGAESELHSIISNLVTNAVKYTPRDGEIEMRWWTDTEGAHLSVRDTGVGIAPEHIPRLTERFYRVDSGRVRELGGSGLGLAIVKHALQQHDGTLTIESTLGRGSKFTCHFPASRIVQRAQVDAEARKLAVD